MARAAGEEELPVDMFGEGSDTMIEKKSSRGRIKKNKAKQREEIQAQENEPGGDATQNKELLT